jgi:hypothetical protein
MEFQFRERESTSPYVDGYWQTFSQGSGSFISAAEKHWGMVITKQQERTVLTIRGPETFSMLAPVPEDADFFGIVFKLGTFMPHLSPEKLVDGELHLPIAASDRKVWLHGQTWEVPTFDNADVFVERLVRAGLIVCDPVVGAVLQGQRTDLSPRSVQRRFLRATGLTQSAICQIDRAHYAMTLLQNNTSILDTVELAGYADQSHLTRSLKRLLGRTPAQVLNATSMVQSEAISVP